MSAERPLTTAEMEEELNNFDLHANVEDEHTGFSDDSVEDETFLPPESDSDDDSDDSCDDDLDAQSENESDDDSVPLIQLMRGNQWQPVAGDRLSFNVHPQNTGCPPQIVAALKGKAPVIFFEHFIDGDIINLLVTETNRFAAQKVAAATSNGKSLKWVDTNPTEMRKFLGILIWMGLLQMTKLRDYWSTNVLYQNSIPKCMSRNRFESILGMFHASDNEAPRPEGNRMYKISKVLDMLQNNYKASYVPEDLVCIDESNVPFRGRLSFRQYIPNKRHRYGIKVFKLCVAGGYTWAFKVYTGKEKTDDMAVSEKVVIELMNGLLDSGRTLYTDNWYTSVSLSKTLLDRKTHLVGTLRANRKGNPSEVIKAKLQKGNVIARQNRDKTVVLKWKDKRDVIMLSTKHDDSVTSFIKKGKEVRKPEVVMDYNKGKGFIDLSDQMAAYSPYVRRTVKWYKRLLFHLITSTTIVNSLHLYNKINNKKMSITNFREAVVLGLLQTEDSVPRPSTSRETSRPACVLREVPGQKRVTRKRCSSCYNNMTTSHNSAYARKNAKRVNTICASCDVPICITCFEKHARSRSLL